MHFVKTCTQGIDPQFRPLQMAEQLLIKQVEFGESIGDLSALSPPFESTTSYGRTTSYQTLKQAVPLEELLAVRTAARYLQ